MATLVFHTTINCNGYWGTSSSVSKVAQSFTTPAGNARDLTSVTLPLGRGSGDYGTVTVGLYAVDGSGNPTGDPLSTGTVAGASLTTYSSGTVARTTYDTTVAMSAYSLAASTTYAIQISPGVSTDQIRWLLNTGSYYSGGKPSRYRTALFPPEGWEDITNGDLEFKVTVAETMTKVTDPVPANSATPGANFSTFTFGWTEGGSGATFFYVYIYFDGEWWLHGLASPPAHAYTTTLAALEDLYGVSPINQAIHWRVDSTDGETIVTGDEWVFDPRPAKVTTPGPANEATGIRMFPTYTWGAAAQAATYNLHVEV